MDIYKVILKTNQLEEMKAFYSNNLGLSFESISNEHFEIKFGVTTVEFTNHHVSGHPFYHFALDIPANQFQEAKEWMKGKVSFLIEDGEDEIYFPNLKANSFYFEDPAGNIIEFIARTEANASSDVPFTVVSCIKMSEMSLVVNDKVQAAKELAKLAMIDRNGEEVKQDQFLSFMTKGDFPVYLLLVNPQRKWLFSPKEATVYPLEIVLDNGLKLGIHDQGDFYVE